MSIQNCIKTTLFPLQRESMLYNEGVNIEEIKIAIKKKGYTVKAFAEVLGVAYGTLRHILAGRQSLTEQLRRHIMLALQSTPAGDSHRLPVDIPLSLPEEIWQAIDKAASGQGISSEQYTAELVQRLAKDISAGLIQSRTGKA